MRMSEQSPNEMHPRRTQRAFPAIAALKNVGLVEMDVALDEACDHQSAVEALLRRLGGDVRGDIDNAAVRDADVDWCLLASSEAGFTQDEIERHDTSALL